MYPATAPNQVQRPQRQFRLDTKTVRTEIGGKFRVVMGSINYKGPKGCDCDNCYKSGGQDHYYCSYEVYYRKGIKAGYKPDEMMSPEQYTNDIIHTEGLDLTAERFNGDGRPEFCKFVRVVETDPAAIIDSLTASDLAALIPSPTFDRLTVSQLITIAEERGVELKGAAKKEAIIALLRAAEEAPPQQTPSQ